jgi:hypothetical protein
VRLGQNLQQLQGGRYVEYGQPRLVVLGVCAVVGDAAVGLDGDGLPGRPLAEQNRGDLQRRALSGARTLPRVLS